MKVGTEWIVIMRGREAVGRYSRVEVQKRLREEKYRGRTDWNKDSKIPEGTWGEAFIGGGIVLSIYLVFCILGMLLR